MDWDKLIELPIYQLNKADKMPIFNEHLIQLAQHHYQQSENYRDIINFLYQGSVFENEVPALAVRLFKHHLLKSINDKDIFKITTSSGTTSQQVSRIVLDKENISRQQKILVKIVQQWLGRKRLPMLIIDHPNVIKDKFSYSARGVGIQGLSLFGHHHTYALNEDMTLNMNAIEEFFEKYTAEPVFIFGFTFIIWQYFIQALKKEKTKAQFCLRNATLLHSGGWKKLQEQAVSNQEFTAQCQQVLGKVNVHNFYGMVEQTGTIYVECELGYLHCPVWSDVIIRSKKDLTPEKNGVEGIIQVNSLLPTSYPGHALLTEDLGVLLGEDDCACGRKGKYFRVNGRLAKAEVRGCSDTQA
ncbi:acyl-protein synthetase [Colwellia sp. 39_35_sub15_T18]|nr:acyl-protein synthetase [Colwellia sp. 39_35_sub15_T18]